MATFTTRPLRQLWRVSLGPAADAAVVAVSRCRFRPEQ